MMLKKYSILARWSTHTNVCILISFNTISLSFFLLSRCFSLSLTSDEVWKLQRSCRSRNLTGCCAALHQTLDDYGPMKVRPLANFFEVASKSRFSSKRSLRCQAISCDARPLLGRSTSGVRCSFLIEHGHGSLVHRRKPFFRCRLDRNFTHHLTAGRTKALSILPALLSGPGTHSTQHRARMVYSSPWADVADWSMP